MPPSPADPENRAYIIAEEHRSGPLQKLTWDELIAELKARSPGFARVDAHRPAGAPPNLHYLARTGRDA